MGFGAVNTVETRQYKQVAIALVDPMNVKQVTATQNNLNKSLTIQLLKEKLL